MKKSILAGALLLAMSTAGASASTVTYDFTSGAAPTGPVGYTLGCDAAYAPLAGCQVSFGANGVGVENVLLPIDYELNNAGFETLIVTFDTAVDLLSIVLGDFQTPPDDYEYSINGGAFSANQNTNPIVVNQSVSSFAIRASVGGLFDVDRFTLESFDINVVPLPAGGLLLASAMGGLALMRRRRSSASAA